MSEIEYPLLMQLKCNKKLVVWMTSNRHGVVVQIRGDENDRYVGEIQNDFSDITNFEPYVRPPEYRYQVMYKTFDCNNFVVTDGIYKDIEDFNNRVTCIPNVESAEIVKASKREVK